MISTTHLSTCTFVDFAAKRSGADVGCEGYEEFIIGSFCVARCCLGVPRASESAGYLENTPNDHGMQLGDQARGMQAYLMQGRSALLSNTLHRIGLTSVEVKLEGDLTATGVVGISYGRWFLRVSSKGLKDAKGLKNL